MVSNCTCTFFSGRSQPDSTLLLLLPFTLNSSQPWPPLLVSTVSPPSPECCQSHLLPWRLGESCALRRGRTTTTSDVVGPSRPSSLRPPSCCHAELSCLFDVYRRRKIVFDITFSSVSLRLGLREELKSSERGGRRDFPNLPSSTLSPFAFVERLSLQPLSNPFLLVRQETDHLDCSPVSDFKQARSRNCGRLRLVVRSPFFLHPFRSLFLSLSSSPPFQPCYREGKS